MSANLKVNYEYLIPHLDKRKKQLYLKNRGCLSARDVVGTMLSNNLTLKETAEAYDLPVAAVEEAWDYYQENRPLVDEEVAQERNAAGLASC